MLFVETIKLFISNIVRVYRYIHQIFQLYVPGVGLLTLRFVPRGGILYTMIVSGGGFLLASSRVRRGGEMALGEIDTCIKGFTKRIFFTLYQIPKLRVKGLKLS